MSSLIVVSVSASLAPRHIHLATLNKTATSVTYTTDWSDKPFIGGISSVEYGQVDVSYPPTTTNCGFNNTFQVPIAYDETSEFIYANISHNLTIHEGERAKRASLFKIHY